MYTENHVAYNTTVASIRQTPSIVQPTTIYHYKFITKELAQKNLKIRLPLTVAT